jgi:hypothetical protein
MESFLKTLRRGLVRKQPTKPAKANDEVLEERANRRPVEAALLDTSISGAEAKTFLGGCDHCIIGVLAKSNMSRGMDAYFKHKFFSVVAVCSC